MKKLTSVLAMAVLMASCNQFDKSKTGMPYKIKKGGSTAKFKQGDFLKFTIEMTTKVAGKDSVISGPAGHMPAYMKFDTAQTGKYYFTEVLPQMSVGDKLDFQLSVDSLKKMGIIQDYNRMLNKGGTIQGKIHILSSFPSEALVNEDFKKESEAEKEREIKTLEGYMAKKNIKAQRTPGGAFVQVTNAGDAANKADSGRQVSVLYKGYTEDGTEFDANMGPKGAGKPPFTVVIGSHGVIPGWEEGLKFFGKGGKGTILVPAMLGYGPQGAGGVIKPFTNLIFDVEITDVTAPPPPAPPTPGMMPGMGQPQMPQQQQQAPKK